MFLKCCILLIKKGRTQTSVQQFQSQQLKNDSFISSPIAVIKESCRISGRGTDRGKTSTLSGFPRDDYCIIYSGESLTVCWLPSACLKIFSSVFCTGMCDFQQSFQVHHGAYCASLAGVTSARQGVIPLGKGDGGGVGRARHGQPFVLEVLHWRVQTPVKVV